MKTHFKLCHTLGLIHFTRVVVLGLWNCLTRKGEGKKDDALLQTDQSLVSTPTPSSYPHDYYDSQNSPQLDVLVLVLLKMSDK